MISCGMRWGSSRSRPPGGGQAQPRFNAALLAHLQVSTRELLQNLADFPDLAAEDLKAALAYAA
jgi:hypothetical protein